MRQRDLSSLPLGRLLDQGDSNPIRAAGSKFTRADQTISWYLVAEEDSQGLGDIAARAIGQLRELVDLNICNGLIPQRKKPNY